MATTLTSKLKPVDQAALDNLLKIWNKVSTEKNISQSDVARLAGVRPASINRTLTGQTPISDKVGKAFSEILGIPLKDLHPKWRKPVDVEVFESVPLIPAFTDFKDAVTFCFDGDIPDEPVTIRFLGDKQIATISPQIKPETHILWWLLRRKREISRPEGEK